MPIDFKELDNEAIEIAVRRDTALCMNQEEHDEYLRSLDKSLLKLRGDAEPTWFVMRKVLPYRIQQKIDKMQLIMTDGEVSTGVHHINEEVRAALIGIKNSDIEFKKHGDGGCSEELFSKIMAFGIVQELYIGRKNFLKGNDETDSERLKKS